MLLADRRRFALYRVAVSGGRVRQDVLLKMRRGVALPPGATGRPELGRPLALSEQVRTEHEFAGLQLIARAAETQPAMHAVMPYRVVAEQCALAMEWVGDPTLRTSLKATSRVAGPRRRAGLEQVMRGAGAWLRCYHQAPRDLQLPERLT